MKFKIDINKMFDDVVIPEYKTSGAACMDVHAYIKKDDWTKYTGRNITVGAGETYVVQTGLRFEIPRGFKITVRPRSSMALAGWDLPNSPGTIDSDYRGELLVIIKNTGQYDKVIQHGDRIAQIELEPVYKMEFDVVDDLTETERGSGGLGSTGK